MKLTVRRSLIPRIEVRRRRGSEAALPALTAPEPVLPYIGLRAAELVLRTVDRKFAYRDVYKRQPTGTVAAAPCDGG